MRMYESGCIYRDNRLVNWDARLVTAVSDIEVDYIDIPGRTLINVPGYDQVRVDSGVAIKECKVGTRESRGSRDQVCGTHIQALPRC